MKTIKLSEAKENVFIGGDMREVTISAKDLIRTSLNSQPQQGFTVDEMMKRLRVLSILDKVNGDPEMELEDSDFETLAACVKQMRWGFVSQGIIDFAQQFS